MARNADVDAILARSNRWAAEFAALREIALASGLDEVVKWGQPCYATEGRNVVLVHGFNDYCALLFMKGALMKDEAKILVRQTENVQSARQARFRSVAEIEALAPMLARYIDEAAAVERAGLKVEKKTTSEFTTPEEFRARLDASPDLAAAFAALTPGRQRAWLLQFSGAKQAATREARIDKATPAILAGKGPND